MSRRAWARRVAREHLPEVVLSALRNVRRSGRSRAAAYRRRPERERFAALVRAGASPEAAAVTTVRELVRDRRTDTAVSFADELAASQATATAGHLAAGVVGVHRRLPELARAEFAEVPADVWRAHAPADYLEAAYRCDRLDAVAAVRQLVTERPGSLGPQVWFDALRYAFVSGELGLAKQAYALLVERAGEDPGAWPAAKTEIAWLRPWLTRDAETTATPPPDGQVPFALIDYKQPGRRKASANIGDHIQTLAALGHLVRHQNVRFHGPDDLVDFVGEMQRLVKPERRLETAPSDVALYTVDRDSSNHQALPEGTWMLAFGWYMHPLFGVRHDFPMHPNLRPIFVSFHCSKREMLTEEAIAYLRGNAPIGCRDWTTVDLLLSLDVPAFFSGCLTTTVDTVVPTAPTPAEPSTIYVDVSPDRVPAGAPTAQHSDPAKRFNSFATNMRHAVAMLDRYRRNHTKVVTPRLHCYLPARSLGLHVDFLPPNRADIRFNGLVDIDDDAFDDMRTRMLSRLEPVMTAILAGEPEDEVYRVWRETCAADVAAARRRHRADPPLPAPTVDVKEATKLVRGAAVDTGPEVVDPVDVAMYVTADDITRLPLTLTSLWGYASRPVRLWLLAWGCGHAEQERVATAFPDLPVTWLPCDELSRDVATLLLPELLYDLERVTVLPTVAVALDDVAKLAEWDLDGHPLAARTTPGTTASSGFARFYRAAQRLHPDAAAAHDLVRRTHARHAFDFDAFDCDVFVADLLRMRADEIGERFLPYVEHLGMTATEVLALYAGPDRAVLPAEWAHNPRSERLASPKLVHWPGAAKPWSRDYVACQDLWTALARRYSGRSR